MGQVLPAIIRQATGELRQLQGELSALQAALAGADPEHQVGLIDQASAKALEVFHKREQIKNLFDQNQLTLIF